ncbi:MAG TPA: Gfo/Idh/MocA family oxidoreductase [Polyangia bacterium]
MNLTPEQRELGRRNFLKAAAGTPALAALIGAVTLAGPKRGGPVKTALVGAGGEGKVLLGQMQKPWTDLRAICDINPKHAAGAADAMEKRGWPRPRVYQDLKEMLEKEDLEAVIVATPLWAHADVSVTALEAGKHVLCEKMMAWDVEGCHRMAEAATKNKRLLEIGYQRFYNPTYQAAYEGIISKDLLGEVYYVRTVWHRNGSWRRDEKPPTPDFDPKPWGYDSWEHLTNWRLYKKHSRGLLAELGSHQIAIANWFFGAAPEAVFSSGNVSRYKDGREVPDHVYSTFEYAGGRTATFTSVQSNAFDDNYEQVMGTKGTLILRGETEAYFFSENDAKAATNLQVTPRTGNAIADASESRAADATSRTVTATGTSAKFDRLLAYRNEINAFCSAIRTGTPLACGPERAIGSASACIRAFEATDQKSRLVLSRA